MKFPVKIAGYAGEHDEAGAKIVDADGNAICTTAHVKDTHSVSAWREYYETANLIVDSLNRSAERETSPTT